jgi:hypothetical protein
MSIEEGNAIYVPCRDCEGDGCIGPNPRTDSCKRCGGSGCEPSEREGGAVKAPPETDRQRADRLERAYDILGIQRQQMIVNQRDNLLMILSHIRSDPAMAEHLCWGLIEWCEENGAEPIEPRRKGPSDG